MRLSNSALPYLQVAPLALILLFFFGVPLLLVVIVSFWTFDLYGLQPTIVMDNYRQLLTAASTYKLYLTTLTLALIVWAISLVLAFVISYFLAFHVRSFGWQVGLLLVCTVPFWTSDIIRMISWIPLLGVHGILNETLIKLGVVREPLKFLLFSPFAVVVAYVNLFTLFMIVPIFNSMARIDGALLEAARDSGAAPWRVIAEVVLPLTKTGIALGSILVLTLVTGDFYVVAEMSGGQMASVVSAMSHQISLLQYPPAAASAVVLLVIVTLMVAGILRIVDVRKELTR
jgi:putative spermidine/putrescine transport system permease protein